MDTIQSPTNKPILYVFRVNHRGRVLTTFVVATDELAAEQEVIERLRRLEEEEGSR